MPSQKPSKSAAAAAPAKSAPATAPPAATAPPVAPLEIPTTPPSLADPETIAMYKSLYDTLGRAYWEASDINAKDTIQGARRHLRHPHRPQHCPAQGQHCTLPRRDAKNPAHQRCPGKDQGRHQLDHKKHQYRGYSDGLHYEGPHHHREDIVSVLEAV